MSWRTQAYTGRRQVPSRPQLRDINPAIQTNGIINVHVTAQEIIDKLNKKNKLPVKGVLQS